MPTLVKNKAHVIEEYKFRANTILCICGWFGDADQAWKDHKYEAKKTEAAEKIEMQQRKIKF